MAEDITSTMQNLAENANSIDQLTKSLESFTDAKKKAFSKGDIAVLLTFTKMEKSLKKLIDTTEKYNRVQEELKAVQKSGKQATEDQLESYVSASSATKKAESEVKSYAKSYVTSFESMKDSMDKTRAESVEWWKQNTRMGKGFSFVTGEIAGWAAKLTMGGLALKALNRHMQAAELRQNIMIQSYQGFDKTIKDTNPGIVGRIEDLVGLDATTKNVTADTFRYSEVMAKTEATANRMGVSTEYVTDSMQKFAKITGGASVETLGTLTRGAITVSRAIGITVPEAVDFVALRMDKFGGSAAGAIVSLNQIQVDAEGVNNAFGRTVIRADDVVRTLSDISRQTNVYAIDQRFVGNILRESTARLQSTGDSYDSASKKATAFTKALAGEAPEWMQTYAGQDMLGTLMKGFNGEELDAAMTKELEAAKPGLAKEIEDVLKNDNIAYYDKTRLVQEMAGASSIGAEAMNKQILKLSKMPHGIEIIKEQFHVSSAVAAGMQKLAIDKEKRDVKVNAYAKMETAELAKQLGISEDAAGVIINTNKNITDRKKAINEIIGLQEDSKAAAADKARLDKQKAADAANKVRLTADIKAYQDMLATAEKAGDSTTIDTATRMIQSKQDELSRYEAKETKKEDKTEGLKTVEEINKALLKSFDGYAKNSGGELKAIGSELSSTKMLLIGAGLLGLNKYFGFSRKMLNRIAETLSEIAINSGAGGGGGAGGDWKKAKRKGSKRGRVSRGRGKYGKSVSVEKLGKLGGKLGKAGKASWFKGMASKSGKLTRGGGRGLAKGVGRGFAKIAGRGLAKGVGAGLVKGASTGLIKGASTGLLKGASTELLKDAGTGLLKGAGKGLSAGKGLLKGIGGLGKRIPFAGALIGGGMAAMDTYSAYKEGASGKELAKVAVKGGGGMLGSAGGAAIGAAIGTLLLPGIGTAIGGVLGGMAGEALGQSVAEKVSDSVMPSDAEKAKQTKLAEDQTETKKIEADTKSTKLVADQAAVKNIAADKDSSGSFLDFFKSKSDAAKVQPMAKETKAPSTPPSTVAALNLTPQATDQAKATTDTAAAKVAADAAASSVSSQSTTTASSEPSQASFGAVQADGSVLIRVLLRMENFLPTMAKTMSMMQQKKIK